MVEIFGQKSSGKTTLALHAIAEVQAKGGVAAFIDAEHALDVSYAGKLGVHLEDLLISQPDTGEQAPEIAEALVRSGGVDLVVIDSVAALVPRAEIEGEMRDQHAHGAAGAADESGPAQAQCIYEMRRLILSEPHLRRPVVDFARFHNTARPTRLPAKSSRCRKRLTARGARRGHARPRRTSP